MLQEIKFKETNGHRLENLANGARVSVATIAKPAPVRRTGSVMKKIFSWPRISAISKLTGWWPRVYQKSWEEAALAWRAC